MTLFIVIIVFYFAQVIGRPVQTILVSIIILFIGLTRLGYIDSGGQDRAFLLVLLLIILSVVFFFSYQAFAEDFKLLERSGAIDDSRL